MCTCVYYTCIHTTATKYSTGNDDFLPGTCSPAPGPTSPLAEENEEEHQIAGRKRVAGWGGSLVTLSKHISADGSSVRLERGVGYYFICLIIQVTAMCSKTCILIVSSL